MKFLVYTNRARFKILPPTGYLRVDFAALKEAQRMLNVAYNVRYMGVSEM